MALRFGSNSARLTGAALVALLLLAGAGPVAAQETSVQNFLVNPQTVLKQNPTGGSTLISEIRDLAVANPATLSSIIGLLAGASKDQKTAIASGLAQAAKIVVKNNQPYANQIALAIAETKDQDVVLAYAGVTGDVPILSTGGGGAGSAGASGGQTNGLFGGPTGTGGAEAIPGGSTPTGTFSYTSSVGGGGSTTTTGTTGSTPLSLTISVSP
jgi:hypothetical protein